jgi:hypothetical protein
MSDIRIRTTVRIREVLSERTARAVLRNGKVILAYAEPGDSVAPLLAGEDRSVLLSLCDFSEGRIVPDDLSRVSVKHAILEGDPVI